MYRPLARNSLKSEHVHQINYIDMTPLAGVCGNIVQSEPAERYSVSGISAHLAPFFFRLRDCCQGANNSGNTDMSSYFGAR